jgi:hypothetical protein
VRQARTFDFCGGKAPLKCPRFVSINWANSNNDDPDGQTESETVRVLSGSRSLWEISFAVGTQPYGKLKIADDAVPSSAQPLLITDLPQDVQREIDKAYEEILKSIGGGG